MEMARGAPQCGRTVMCSVLALTLEDSNSQWEEERGVCFQVRQACFAKSQTAHFLSSKAHVLFKEADERGILCLGLSNLNPFADKKGIHKHRDCLWFIIISKQYAK